MSAEAPYGYCPECGARGMRRERRPGGNDMCERGHTYLSAKAIDGHGRLIVDLPDECFSIHQLLARIEERIKRLEWLLEFRGGDPNYLIEHRKRTRGDLA